MRSSLLPKKRISSAPPLVTDIRCFGQSPRAPERYPNHDRYSQQEMVDHLNISCTFTEENISIDRSKEPGLRPCMLLIIMRKKEPSTQTPQQKRASNQKGELFCSSYAALL
mmetsp:Transcript_4302/g.11997  ORF Transcript_4302/g.11997 Transcript_4302/m.11997 type:complete len:111 (+) Transcript_4302:1662-1994(+)